MSEKTAGEKIVRAIELAEIALGHLRRRDRADKYADSELREAADNLSTAGECVGIAINELRLPEGE